MICPSCGTANDDANLLCSNCSQPLNASPAPQRPKAHKVRVVPQRKSSRKMIIITWIVILILCVVVVAIYVNIKNNENTTTPMTPVTPTPPADIVLNGTGDTVTQTFTLTAGNTIYSITHNGTGYFGIWLKDQAGAQKELLVNTAGTYSGNVLKGVTDDNIIGATPGTYYLDISADGAWTVTIKQPRTTIAPSLPQTFTGTSDDAKAIMLTSGAIRFDMSYTGTDYFAVILHDAEGNYISLLANEIGTYGGSKSQGIIAGGVYYLTITGIGSWSVTVSHM